MLADETTTVVADEEETAEAGTESQTAETGQAPAEDTPATDAGDAAE